MFRQNMQKQLKMTKTKKFIFCGILIIPMFFLAIFLYGTKFIELAENKVKSSIKEHKTPEETDTCMDHNQKSSSIFWRNVDLQQNNIPQEIKNSASSVEVQSNLVKIKGATVHYIFAEPTTLKKDRISVLLLHGQAFSSKTWKDLGTINLLSALGYFTVAVDLPGFGGSPKMNIKDKSSFIDEMISTLELINPVIVSPSMSGSYSLNFLLEHNTKLRGFVPVSPVGTSVLENDMCNSDVKKDTAAIDKTCDGLMHYLKDKGMLNLGCIKVPTMIVFGEHDHGANSAKLCHLPFSQAVEIPDGKHAAYLSNPEMWHKLLYNFLTAISNTINCISQNDEPSK